MLKGRPRRSKSGGADFLPRTLGDWVGIVANSVVALSAVMALFQYTESLRNQRVDRTLTFIHQFRDDQHLPSVMAVDLLAQRARALADKSIDAPTLSSLPPKEAAAVKDQFVRTVVYEVSAETGEPILPRPIIDITGFFNELQVCVEHHVCDRETAHAFFDDYARVFWINFRGVVAFERQRRPEFAGGMERFVREAQP